MEIVQERLEREFDLDLITTVPTVEYHVYTTDGDDDAAGESEPTCPTPRRIDRIEEPYVKARIMAPAEYIGGIMKLGQERRGVYNGMHYIDTDPGRVPLRVPAGRDRARLLRQAQVAEPRVRLARLRDGGLPRVGPGQARHADQRRPGRRVQRHHPPRQGAGVRPQGRGEAQGADSRGSSSRWRSRRRSATRSSPARRSPRFRKDVLAKCYGGDITRKRKLLEKQKEGKKRMKQVGAVEIPQEAFLAVLAGGMTRCHGGDASSSSRPPSSATSSSPRRCSRAGRSVTGPVDVVTTPAAAALLETHPAVREVIRYDKRGAGRGLARALSGWRRELRARRYAPGVSAAPLAALGRCSRWLPSVPERVGLRRQRCRDYLYPAGAATARGPRSRAAARAGRSRAGSAPPVSPGADRG